MIILKRQMGITLVEVLVTVLITSAGILGLASLQGFSMKMSHDSYLRTQATFLARDLGDRMLTNTGASYAMTDDEATAKAASTGQTPNCASGTQDVVCSADQMRDHDLFHWVRFANEVMPKVKLEVVGPPAGVSPEISTIKITWNNNSGSSEQFLQYKVQ